MEKPGIYIPMEQIKSFCKKWKIKEFSLFGSALREDFQPDSDIDILVELQPGHGLTLYDWIDMIDELKSIFGREVDLVEKTTINNPFRHYHIFKTYKVIYAA